MGRCSDYHREAVGLGQGAKTERKEREQELHLRYISKIYHLLHSFTDLFVMCASVHLCVVQAMVHLWRPEPRNGLSLSTMWLLEIELNLSDLVVRVFSWKPSHWPWDTFLMCLFSFHSF